MSGARTPLAVAPADMDEDAFMAAFGAVYEDSSWVARIVWWEFPHAGLESVEGLHAAMREVVERAPRDLKLALMRAHPDLAGRAAKAGDLSESSVREQAGAGLDRCSEEEYEAFQRLNEAYKAKFAFPFIVAVGGLNRAQILELFRFRLDNSPRAEFETGMAEIHKIAGLRLHAMRHAET